MKIAKIYRITNIINNKIYIGFTTKDKVITRWYEHLFFARHKTYNSKLHKAIRKYGESNFTIEEIYCSKDIEHTFTIMEKYFIKKFDSINTGYNLSEGGRGPLNIKRSIESRLKQSKKLKGRKFSEETRKKFSIAAKARIEKIPNKLCLGSKEYIIIDNFGIRKIKNLKHFAEDNNTTRSILGYSLKYKKEHHGYLVLAA